MFESLQLSPPFADQPYPLLSWVLASLAVVLIGIAKSGFGGGVGIVAVPLYVLAAGSKDGLGALLPLLIAADIFSLGHHWRKWDVPNLRHLLPGSILGIVAGSVILWLLLGRPALDMLGTLPEQSGVTAAEAAEKGREQAENALKLAVGVICVAYGVGDLVRQRLSVSRPYPTGPIKGALTGLLAGIVSTIGHAAGPITAIYMLGQKLDRQRFIGTAVCYYFIVNTIKLLPYALLGLIHTGSLLQGLLLLPLVPVGTFLGAWLNRRLSEHLFRGIIMAIVLATGVHFMFTTLG